MRRLTFEVAERVLPSAPERVDVACFVGFVRRRPHAPVSDALLRYLSEQGWTAEPTPRVNPNEPLDALLDVPLPFESFSAFERHFAWEARNGTEPDEATALGAAVRSFFAQGGRKCYVVRMGDPLPPEEAHDKRGDRLNRLLPGSRFPAPEGFDTPASPVDRATWHGLAHLFGLTDISFLCLPDLPEVFAEAPKPRPEPHLPPAGEPQFVECAPESGLSLNWQPPERTAPRCDITSYQEWAGFLFILSELLRSRLREVHLIAALPRPSPSLMFIGKTGRQAAEQDFGLFLQTLGVLSTFQSAFIQLAWPWVETSGSQRLPERLEAPDGVLAGVLARNALLRGTFRSALGLPLADVRRVAPSLDRVDLTPRRTSTQLPSLVERVSLLGPTPRGMHVLSDVTSSPLMAHRPAPVSRLISSVLRAARHVGLELAFSPSNESSWRALRQRIEFVLGQFFEAGALRGATPQEAFSVRCDRSTMTQDDLDAGRMIARVELEPAAVLERIQVQLMVVEGGATRQQGEAA